jgi:uncharacterized protein (TIGR02453 family)
MFAGFTPETVDFMWGIRFNNEKSWFLEHKQTYLDTLYAPMRALGEEIARRMNDQYPELGLDLHVSRIYRDARRLHGRGPYKDHLWFSLRPDNRCDDWTGRPTYYFELTPEYYSYGMGFWSPKAATMTRFRHRLDEHPEEFAKLVRKFNKQTTFVSAGSSYARPKGDPGKLLYPWYQKRSISLEHELPLDDIIYSPALAEEMMAGFEFLIPFYRYFKTVTDSIAE